MRPEDGAVGAGPGEPLRPVRVGGHGPAGAVGDAVVVPAQRRQVLGRGRAAVGPVDDVVMVCKDLRYFSTERLKLESVA